MKAFTVLGLIVGLAIGSGVGAAAMAVEYGNFEPTVALDTTGVRYRVADIACRDDECVIIDSEGFTFQTKDFDRFNFRAINSPTKVVVDGKIWVLYSCGNGVCTMI